jgi:predicted ArsR family transcriptional regulator
MRYLNALMTTKLDKRFFDSTRGRIVALMRGSRKTVSELASELGLTDNAVRAHLLSLERDGLIRQRGVQKGTRKPHFSYELTNEADHLFPKAYDALLNQLISVLKQRLTPELVDEVLREVGRSLGKGTNGQKRHEELERRVASAITVLESIGGAAKAQRQNGHFLIHSESCPLSAAVAEHPEVCRLAETLLSEIIGTKVEERCEREGSPRCRFEVKNSN